jgi:glutathione S-transferase
MLELYQTEWCPASRRVRQRLTELDLEYIAHQVPVVKEQRCKLEAATRQTSIPALVEGPRVVVGETAILDYLDSRFPESDEARLHREKAAKARRRDLEEACQQLILTTH